MVAVVYDDSTVVRDDPAWCYKCNRDTAFCTCVCYICGNDLEECHCHCALCDTPVKGGGLCPTHKAAWNEEIQGPALEEARNVGVCVQCGIQFNRAFLLEAPYHRNRIQRTAYNTDRTLCLRCDKEGKFKGDRPSIH